MQTFLGKQVVGLTAGASALAMSAGPAMAFDAGFVRVPDWMDKYFVILVPVTVILLGLTWLTKPRGVPFNQLYRTPLTGLNRASYNALVITFVALMGLLFTGMGLQRLAEGG